MKLRIKESWVVGSLLLAGLLAGVALNRQLSPSVPALAPEIEGLLWPSPPQVAPFSLLNKAGAPFTEQDLRGQWDLLFFGFTHCPDVCPTTLRTLTQVQARFRAETGLVLPRVIFVSVDPERDPVETVREYVDFFSPEFEGLTGDSASVTKMTRNLGIIAVKTQQDGQSLHAGHGDGNGQEIHAGEQSAEGNYGIDHTVSLLLVDPQGRLSGILTAPHVATDLPARIANIMDFVNAAD